jgi:hypothetical protein
LLSDESNRGTDGARSDGEGKQNGENRETDGEGSYGEGGETDGEGSYAEEEHDVAAAMPEDAGSDSGRDGSSIFAFQRSGGAPRNWSCSAAAFILPRRRVFAITGLTAAALLAYLLALGAARTETAGHLPRVRLSIRHVGASHPPWTFVTDIFPHKNSTGRYRRIMGGSVSQGGGIGVADDID